jgi:hypothetical protein
MDRVYMFFLAYHLVECVGHLPCDDNNVLLVLSKFLSSYSISNLTSITA